MPEVVAIIWAAIVAYGAQAIVTAIVSLIVGTIAYNLLKKDIEPPEIGQQLQFTQEATPPLQFVNGTAWIAPKIIRSDNGPAYHGPGDPRGYSLYCVVADHQVLLNDIKFNGQHFLTDAELARVKDDKYVGCFRSHGDDVSNLRRETNNRREYGTGDLVLGIVGKFKGWFTTRPRQDGDPWYGVPVTGSNVTIPFEEVSSIDIMHYAVAAGEGNWVDARGHSIASRVAMRFTGEFESDMHGYDMTTLLLVFPINADKTKLPVWQGVPNVLVNVTRPLAAMRLWDPTLPGMPPIDPAWREDNAALNCCDFLLRLTDYATSICDEPRINFQSIAEAAAYCHDQGYYYPLSPTDDEWARTPVNDRAGFTIRRKVWKQEYTLSCNGTFNLSNNRQQILREYEKAMGDGRITQTRGVVSVHAGQPRVPTMGYDDDEILKGSWQVDPFPDRPTRRGITQVSYLDPDGDQKSEAFKHPLAHEQNFKVQTQSSIFINQPHLARRLAWIQSRRAWETERIGFKISHTTPRPNIDDAITVSMPSRGVRGTYRVQSIALDGRDQTVDLVVTSEPTDLYYTPSDAYYAPTPEPPILIDTIQDTRLLTRYTDDGDPVYLQVRPGVVLSTAKLPSRYNNDLDPANPFAS